MKPKMPELIDKIRAGSIVQKLKERRQALGITQFELAEAAGVSHNTIEKMDAGIQTNPTIDTVEKIDGALFLLESRLAKASASIITKALAEMKSENAAKV